MPNDLPGSQGFMSGFTTGLVHTILGKQKQEEDQFHDLKQSRAKLLAGLAEHIRQEDLPGLIQGIDGVLASKNADKANAAFGDVIGKFISEQYGQEQEAQAMNAQSQATAQEQQGQYQSDLAQGGEQIGVSPEGVPVRGMVREPDAQPIPLNPNAYAKDKIRMQTEEGKQKRAINLYTRKEAALYDEKVEFEKARQEGIRETNKQKIEETFKRQGIKGIKYAVDAQTGNTVAMYVDPVTKEWVTKEFEGVELPQTVTAEMRIEGQKKLQELKGKQRMEEIKTQIAFREKDLASKERVRQAQIENIKNNIKTGGAKANSPQYKQADILMKRFDQYSATRKTELAELKSEIDKIVASITISEATKEGRIAPLKDRILTIQDELQTQLNETNKKVDELINFEGPQFPTKANPTPGSKPTETSKSTKPQLTTGNILNVLKGK